MGMRQFFRWRNTPIIDGLASPILPDDCPVQQKYEYKMPAMAGDEIRFIASTTELGVEQGKFYGIGLMGPGVNGCTNIASEIGTMLFNEEFSQVFISVNLPMNLVPRECYRFHIHEITKEVIADWTQVSVACEIDALGNKTGNQLVTEQREVSATLRRPMVVSNPIRIMPEYNRKKTKVVTFKGSGIDYGYDYSANPEFFQQVRLELQIAEASHPVSTKVYEQTNGVFRRGNTKIGKQYILNTEYFDEPTHDAFVNALHHDIIEIDGKRYFASGAYEPRHQETALVPDRFHPMWSASIEVKEQGYNQRNNACQLETDDFRIYGDQYSDIYA